MGSVKATAHRAGLVYFVFMILGILGEFVLPGVVVPGDPAATVAKLTSGEAMYRLSILNSFATLVIFILLVAILYRLFREVDRGQAMAMVLLVCVGVAVALANMLARFAPLVILAGADYLSAFTKPQLDALILGILNFHARGGIVATGFWGLWLFPFGILVIRSGYFPRILGWMLLAAGVGYVVTSAVGIVLPDFRAVIFRAMMPLYFGEVPIILWLLIKGAREPQPPVQSFDGP